MERVDETIKAICEWIQNELENSDSVNEHHILPDMTKALAELVSARAASVKYDS